MTEARRRRRRRRRPRQEQVGKQADKSFLGIGTLLGGKAASMASIVDETVTDGLVEGEGARAQIARAQVVAESPCATSSMEPLHRFLSCMMSLDATSLQWTQPLRYPQDD